MIAVETHNDCTATANSRTQKSHPFNFALSEHCSNPEKENPKYPPFLRKLLKKSFIILGESVKRLEQKVFDSHF
jgi:hypothetical protein